MDDNSQGNSGEEATLRMRLNVAEARKAAALKRKKELDDELKQLQQEEDAGALSVIRNRLKS